MAIALLHRAQQEPLGSLGAVACFVQKSSPWCQRQIWSSICTLSANFIATFVPPHRAQCRLVLVMSPCATYGTYGRNKQKQPEVVALHFSTKNSTLQLRRPKAVFGTVSFKSIELGRGIWSTSDRSQPISLDTHVILTTGSRQAGSQQP